MTQVKATEMQNATAPQFQLEKYTSRLDKVNREYKEAEHGYTLADRNRLAVQRKHDVCLARILNLFERKERRCTNELFKAIVRLVDHWSRFLVKLPKKSTAELAASIKALDIDSDAVDWVQRDLPEVKLADPKRVRFSSDLREDRYDVAMAHCKEGYRLIKLVHAMVEESINADELETKLLKKIRPSFNITACPSQSLAAAFTKFTATLDGILDTIERQLAPLRMSVSKGLFSERHELKLAFKALDKEYQDANRQVERAQQELDRAVADEKRAAAALALAKEKKSKATGPNAPVKRGLFSKASPSEVLQQKEEAATRDSIACQKNMEMKANNLVSVKSGWATNVRGLLNRLQEMESKRVVVLQSCMQAMCDHQKSHLHRVRSLINDLEKQVQQVDLERDIQLFISNSHTSNQPPPCVLEDYNRKVGEEKEKGNARASSGDDGQAPDSHFVVSLSLSRRALSADYDPERNDGTMAEQAEGELSPMQDDTPQYTSALHRARSVRHVVSFSDQIDALISEPSRVDEGPMAIASAPSPSVSSLRDIAESGSGMVIASASNSTITNSSSNIRVPPASPAPPTSSTAAVTASSSASAPATPATAPPTSAPATPVPSSTSSSAVPSPSPGLPGRPPVPPRPSGVHAHGSGRPASNSLTVPQDGTAPTSGDHTSVSTLVTATMDLLRDEDYTGRTSSHAKTHTPDDSEFSDGEGDERESGFLLRGHDPPPMSSPATLQLPSPPRNIPALSPTFDDESGFMPVPLPPEGALLSPPGPTSAPAPTSSGSSHDLPPLFGHSDEAEAVRIARHRDRVRAARPAQINSGRPITPLKELLDLKMSVVHDSGHADEGDSPFSADEHTESGREHRRKQQLEEEVTRFRSRTQEEREYSSDEEALLNEVAALSPETDHDPKPT